MAMDSGNSNYIESSNGGGYEFGSLPDSVVPPFLNPSLVSHTLTPTILGAQGLGQVPFSSSSSMQPRPVEDSTNGVIKNPKKRTRASRKAPTTVLTTDTTNFRSMVQECTGIPAPPFSTSSSFSPRLGLFGSGSLGIRSSHLEALRSSANNRVQPATASTPLFNNNIPLVDEASNMLNLQNQMVQPDLSQGTSVSASSSTMASLDELGLHGNWRGGIRLNDGNYKDNLRPFDGW